MSEDPRTRRRIIEEPYFVIDALLDYGLSEIFSGDKDDDLLIQRRPRTTGSARYIVKVDKQVLLTVDIVAVAANKTVMQSTLNEDVADIDTSAIFIGLINIPFDVVVNAIEGSSPSPHKSEADKVIDTIRAMRTSVETRRPTPPKRGDSLDAWLDYREREAKKHNKITLQHIATEGGFTLISVKRASAERKPRGQES